MQAHNLKPNPGSTHTKKRIGRGNSSGHGTYSGRGLKGQFARSNNPRRFFEGGQTELMRKLPRGRGFKNPFRVEYTPVNVRDLNRFDEGTEITPEFLEMAGLVAHLRNPVKVLGMGDISTKLTVRVHKFSMSAKEKIEAAGGTAEEITSDGDAG
ncbi:MAG: 50S ribosomal protein L15 [Chloroflexota bacterium]